MKSIHIYLHKDEFKIITGYQIRNSYITLGQPTYIIPKGDIGLLSKAISESINTSKIITEVDADKMHTERANTYKALEISSLQALARISTFQCSLYVEKKKISLTPYVYLGRKEGATAEESRTIHFPKKPGALAIAKAVVELSNQTE